MKKDRKDENEIYNRQSEIEKIREKDIERARRVIDSRHLLF